MSDDFGLINLVGTPFLEKISREERLGDELPQKSRYRKTVKARKKPTGNDPDASQTDENSLTSHLIDLRI